MGASQSTQSGSFTEEYETEAKEALKDETILEVVPGDPAKRNILLVGSSGRGKSSTGNFILGQAVFKTSDSMETKPERIDCKDRDVDGLKINVCDALTIPEKRLPQKEARAIITARLKECLTVCPEGFHFIIFVFSFIHRVTPEEHVAAEILIEMFGGEFLKKQAITVFTNGEDFDLHRNRSKCPDFDTWYEKAQDPLHQRMSKHIKAVLLYEQPLDEMLERRNDILKAMRKSKVCRGEKGFKTTSQKSDNFPNRNQNRQCFQKRQKLDDQLRNPGQTQSDCDVEIFLLGKTGNGISSTGNTILGYDAFTVDSSTSETAVRWTKTSNGLMIKVVDCPGLLSTKLSPQQRLEQLHQNLAEGFMHCPNGFHALVLVLKYGARFTREEQKVLEMFKHMLGNDFTEKHCILVFTDGESFSRKYENKDFIDWCKETDGELAELITECNHRVVLFHNLTREKARESIDQLISFALGLEGRCKKEILFQIEKERAQLIKDQDAAHLEDPIQSKISLIIRYLEENEKSSMLSQVADDLEKEIGNLDPTKQFVIDVQSGIAQIRKQEYMAALDTFRHVQDTGNREMNVLATFFYAMFLAFLKLLGLVKRPSEENHTESDSDKSESFQVGIPDF